MIPYKVNADYELALFHNMLGPQKLNQALEFFPLFLSDRPVLSSKKYSETYLSYIEGISGNKPQFVIQGKTENWWGDLKNIDLEKKLNSKELSAQLMIDEKWCEDTQIINSIHELKIKPNKQYLAKDPYGMSGQNFVVFTKGEEGKLPQAKLLIIEPLFERKWDFSHYVFNDQVICYENVVDERFQYKGSLFQDISATNVQNLSFYSEISREEWDKFQQALKRIIAFYKEAGAPHSYSIDSFVYKTPTGYKIRFLSEINYRRTMGRTAYELSLKYAGEKSWSLMILGKPLKEDDPFHYIQNKIEAVKWNNESKEGVIQLSPGDSRFEIFLLTARSKSVGEKLFQLLNKLLPGCQFAVKF